jgi:hypothetical protein
MLRRYRRFDWLLGHAPPLEACDEYGEMALVQAARYGFGKIACLMVKAGADMSLNQGKEGRFRILSDKRRIGKYSSETLSFIQPQTIQQPDQGFANEN